MILVVDMALYGLAGAILAYVAYAEIRTCLIQREARRSRK